MPSLNDVDDDDDDNDWNFFHDWNGLPPVTICPSLTSLKRGLVIDTFFWEEDRIWQLEL